MSTPLRILHLGKFYPPHFGGIETHLESLCSALHDRVHVSALVANQKARTQSEVIGGVPVTRLASLGVVASTSICPGMTRRIRRTPADIIHLHLPNPMAAVAYLRSGHTARLVITYHSDTVRQKALSLAFRPLLRTVLQRAAGIIATSPNYRDTSMDLARHRARCVVIPYGIDISRFAEPEPDVVRNLRRKFGERVVLALGRLVYYKGFEYLIRAMPRVRGRLILVGDGPLRSSLERLAATLGVADRVVFTGAVDDAVPYYHTADVFVLPSIARSEAFGIVQIEAMAAGLPVVNTLLDSGVPFVSPNGVTGLSVPPRDAEALANAINVLLDDPELRAAYGHAARERAAREFTIERMANETLRLYGVVKQSARRVYRTNSWERGTAAMSLFNEIANGA